MWAIVLRDLVLFVLGFVGGGVLARRTKASALDARAWAVAGLGLMLCGLGLDLPVKAGQRVAAILAGLVLLIWAVGYQYGRRAELMRQLATPGFSSREKALMQAVSYALARAEAAEAGLAAAAAETAAAADRRSN